MRVYTNHSESYGYHLPELKKTLKELVKCNYVLSAEKIPFREMDLIRTLIQCNIRHNLKIINSFKKTLLNNNPDVFSLQRVDAYNITHTIFYLTDFGFSNKIEVDTRKMSK